MDTESQTTSTPSSLNYILTTPRLKLREINPDSPTDVAFIINLWNDPTIIAGVGDRNIKTYGDGLNCIANMQKSYQQNGFGSWVVELHPPVEPNEVNGQQPLPIMIGIAGVLKRDCFQHPDLGWCLLQDYQHRGFGTELSLEIMQWYANFYNKHDASVTSPVTISAFASLSNIASQNLLLKVGFARKDDVVLPWNNDTYFEKDIIISESDP